MNTIEKKLRDDLATACFEFRQADVQVKKLQAQMEKLRARINYISSVVGARAVDEAEAGTSTVNGESYSATTLSGKTAAEVIELVLREAGTRLRLKQIVDRAIAQGYATEADMKRVRANFSSLLTRAASKEGGGRFKKEGRGIFALASNND